MPLNWDHAKRILIIISKFEGHTIVNLLCKTAVLPLKGRIPISISLIRNINIQIKRPTNEKRKKTSFRCFRMCQCLEDVLQDNECRVILRMKALYARCIFSQTLSLRHNVF